MINFEKAKNWLRDNKYEYNSSMNYYYKSLPELDVVVYIDISYHTELTGNSLFDKMNHGIQSRYSYITSNGTLKEIQEALQIVDSDYDTMIKESKEE